MNEDDEKPGSDGKGTPPSTEAQTLTTYFNHIQKPGLGGRGPPVLDEALEDA